MTSELMNTREEYSNKNPEASSTKIFGKILDYKGAILQAAGLFTLTYMLIVAQKFGFSPYDIVLIVLAIIFGGLFVWVESKHDEPLFSFNVFRSITFSAYITGLLLNYISFIYGVVHSSILSSEGGRCTGKCIRNPYKCCMVLSHDSISSCRRSRR